MLVCLCIQFVRIKINRNYQPCSILDPVHTAPDPYGHHINLKSLKASMIMTLKFVIILQNLIKANHRKSGKSKYDRKLTELNDVQSLIGLL